MKFQILIEILYMLLARKKVTAKAVADRFDISLRTAYRYLTDIELANVPLIVERGLNGGYYIADTFKLPAAFFTEKEYSRLISIIEAFEKQIGAADLEAIKDKLNAASRTEKPFSIRSADLIIDGSDWFGSDSYKNKLAVITRAIDGFQLLDIGYHDRGGEFTRRIIEPHALCLKQGLWYVYAYCRLRKDFRLFKIGRIEFAGVCGSFTRREFDADNLPFNGWADDLERTEFEFEVDRSIMSDVEEWLGVENVHELKNGKIIASAKLPYDKGLVHEILKFGANIKVIRPESVKKEIAQAASEIVKIYADERS